jgi:exopolysaccharide production protein ExoQ
MKSLMNPSLQSQGGRRIPQLVLAWVLLFPLLYLTVHGRPSFQQSSMSVDDQLSLAANAMSTEQDSKGVIFYSLYLAYGVVLYVCLKQARRMWQQLSLCWPVLGLALLAMASALWSQVPMVSFRSGRYYVLDTIFACLLVVSFETEELMTLVMMLGMSVAALGLAVVVFFPQYGIVHDSAHTGVWRGIFSEKNDAAKNLVFLLTPVCNRRILRPISLAYGTLVFFMILMTRSATAVSILAIYVAFVVGLTLLRRMKSRDASFSVMFTAVLLMVMGIVGYFEFARIAALLGRDPTFTGRTDIWLALSESIKKRPLLGYGYSAFWTGLDGESGKLYAQLHWFFTYAHSGVLEICLQLGFVGLAAVAYMLAKAIRNTFYVVRRDSGVGVEWLAGLLFVTLLYNVDEGTILFPHMLVSVFFVIAYVGLAKHAQTLRRLAPATHRVHATQIAAEGLLA